MSANNDDKQKPEIDIGDRGSENHGDLGLGVPHVPPNQDEPKTPEADTGITETDTGIKTHEPY